MRRFLPIVLLFTVYCLLFTPSPVYAQVSVWQGNCVYYHQGTPIATLAGFECLLNNVLSIALTGLGLVMFVMLVVGGFKYLTAGGDPKAMESAKGTLTWAIAGLILAILAWFILSAIQNLTGVNVTTFTIPLQ